MSEESRSRLGSFLLGGVIGGLAGLAAARIRSRQRAQRAPGPPGLSSFEEAPCYQELFDPERPEPDRFERAP